MTLKNLIHTKNSHKLALRLLQTLEAFTDIRWLTEHRPTEIVERHTYHLIKMDANKESYMVNSDDTDKHRQKAPMEVEDFIKRYQPYKEIR